MTDTWRTLPEGAAAGLRGNVRGEQASAVPLDGSDGKSATERVEWGIRATWPDGKVDFWGNPGFSDGEQWARVCSRAEHNATLTPVRRTVTVTDWTDA